MATHPPIPPQLDETVEHIQRYCPGGYHPISIGDVFDQGRFKVLHKLGFGGSSTVWLARDLREGEYQGRIVTLKAMCAEISSFQSPEEIPELAIPKKLRASLPPSEPVNFQTVDHHFFVKGPNGSHLFLIFPLAGPSVFAMSDSPGRVAGSRRLRADSARKVAKQIATTVYHMHNVGVVHGDLTTSNILFSISPHVVKWSDSEVYGYFGKPETKGVVTITIFPPPPHGPDLLVAPVQNSKISHYSFLQENIIVGDFSGSYIAASPPPSYEPKTIIHYQSPEAWFEGRAGFEADIWSLGCAIFEIRAGFPLFESFMATDVGILRQMIQMLGRFPDPWWDAFEDHSFRVEEDGRPKSEQDQEPASVLLNANTTSIKAKVLEIGKQHDLPFDRYDEGPMIEKYGVLVPDKEVELLSDLLGKMLRYRPEERIRIQDVIRHPWFAL